MQTADIDAEIDLTFHQPFSYVLAGPSASGKSFYLIHLIRSNLISPKPTKIYWYSGSKNNLLPNNIIHCSDLKSIGETSYPPLSLIVLDDLAEQQFNLIEVARLFSHRSHHEQISVVLITQNLYQPGKYTRSITLNAKYIQIFKSPRDISSISILNRQLFPAYPKFLSLAYEDATHDKPNSYLLIDLTQQTKDSQRVKTNILSDIITVYQPAGHSTVNR